MPDYLEQAAPFLAVPPAWRRRRRLWRSRHVIEALVSEAGIRVADVSAHAQQTSEVKRVVDAAVFLGPQVPEYGAYYEGTLPDITTKLARDLRDITGGPEDEAEADLPQNEVNGAIDGGGILVLLSHRRPVAIYSSSFSGNDRLTAGEVTRVMRALRYIDDVDTFDDRADVRIGTQLSSYTRVFSLGQVFGRQPLPRRRRL